MNTFLFSTLFAITGLHCVAYRARNRPELECKSALRLFAQDQRWFREARGRYAATFEELRYRPSTRKMLFTMGPWKQSCATTVLPEADGWAVSWAMVPARVEGNLPVGVSEDAATAVCVGDLDGDAEVDVWSVSTSLRHARSGDEIPAGVPWHDRIDREEDK